MRIGRFGVVVADPSSLGGMVGLGDIREARTSSAPKAKQASRIKFVSTTQVKRLPYCPPDARPWGPLRSWSIMYPASRSETP